jgi:hypothetical protein
VATVISGESLECSEKIDAVLFGVLLPLKVFTYREPDASSTGAAAIEYGMISGPTRVTTQPKKRIDTIKFLCEITTATGFIDRSR